MEAILTRFSHIVWGRGTLFLVLITGCYFTIFTGFFPFRRFGFIVHETVLSLFHPHPDQKVSPCSAMAAALGGTMGVGNILGVASAIRLGGPGAVLWIWIGALTGMMVKFAEVTLSLRYRTQSSTGYCGGPMYYMEYGLSCRWMGVCFAVFCILGSFGMGNITQGNAASVLLHQTFGVPLWCAGLLLALFCYLAAKGGAKQIISVSSVMVPVMSCAYLVGAAIILWKNKGEILPSFCLIFKDSVQASSLSSKGVGCAAGLISYRAMEVGISRGIFTNESGLGSAPIAHACADIDLPARQGLWGIVEVFLDTIIVCTITALVILTTHAQSAMVPDEEVTSWAFATVFGSMGKPFITISILFFAVASMFAWCLYGQQCLSYLHISKRGKSLYILLFALFAFLSAFLNQGSAWAAADLINGCMMLPNLFALLFLSPEVFIETKRLENMENRRKKWYSRERILHGHKIFRPKRKRK